MANRERLEKEIAHVVDQIKKVVNYDVNDRPYGVLGSEIIEDLTLLGLADADVNEAAK